MSPQKAHKTINLLGGGRLEFGSDRIRQMDLLGGVSQKYSLLPNLLK
uniref:Uncharacterized protein n=1 Tax=Anguilla anguilla TaxID=7936 RepID=A0A0E9XYU6_ANGAN